MFFFNLVRYQWRLPRRIGGFFDISQMRFIILPLTLECLICVYEASDLVEQHLD